MSEQDRPGAPDDGPVIGGGPPTPPPPPPAPRETGQPGPAIGAPGEAPPPPARRTVDPWESQHLRREPPAARDYGRDSPRADYFGATNRSPGRTAAIYFFALAALVIGGILIFLLFRVLNEGEDEQAAPTPAPIVAEARIESPLPGKRVVVNDTLDVIVSIASGELVERMELLVSGIIADREFSPEPVGEGTRYAGVLTARFEAAGTYELVVRAVTGAGQVITSEPVQVVAIPPVTEAPVVVITGELIAVASLRTGPGEEYNQAGTLEPGDTVTLIGKTSGLQWLQIERGGGLWVRRSAVEVSAADLDRVRTIAAVDVAPPATEPARPTQAAGTATPAPTATPSPTPAVSPNAPDFIPSNAALIEGGATLRITLTNTSTNPFSGAIVVRVEDVPASPAEQVVNVSLEPNGSAALNFAIEPRITEQSSVTVTIDPDNAIPESNEDNNTTEFVLAPPPEGPVLSLAPSITGGELSVVIRNDGDDLATNDARLVMSVPGSTTTQTISPLAIPAGESIAVMVNAVPRTGESIRVTLFIDGVNVATASVPNPIAGDDPTPTATPSEPEEPQETPASDP